MQLFSFWRLSWATQIASTSPLAPARIPRMRRRVLAILLFASISQLAFAPLALAARPAHPLPPPAKISFPKQVGAFKRQGAPKPDMLGYPTATYHAGALGWATVYHYPTAGLSLAQGHAGARDQVKIASPSAKLRSDRAERISLGGAPRDGRRAVFTVTMPGKMRAKSQLIMFSRGQYFLKFRITYRLEHAARMEQEIDRFLASFPWPGG